MRNESTEGCKAPHYLLYPLEVTNQAHICYGRDFLGIGLDPSLKNNKIEEHASGNPKNAFFGILLDPFGSKTLESFI